MLAPSADRMHRHCRSAFTLLEVLVVLTILSLGAALVLSLPRRDRPGGDPAALLMERARGLAVQRGQPMILRVASDGSWTLQPDGAADSVPAATGRLGQPRATALAVRLTPFGGCASLAGADRDLDALRCRSLTATGGAQ